LDSETRQAIKRLAAAVDSVSGMAAGLAAYVATLEGAARVDRRKAIGLSRKLVPEGLSGSVAPAQVAQAMIEQVAALAREINTLRVRLDRSQPPAFAPGDDHHDRPSHFRFTRGS
jgi:hypothetical protein